MTDTDGCLHCGTQVADPCPDCGGCPECCTCVTCEKCGQLAESVCKECGRCDTCDHEQDCNFSDWYEEIEAEDGPDD